MQRCTAARFGGCNPLALLWRCIWPMVYRALAWWAWPKPRCEKRGSGCARLFLTAVWRFPATNASPSIWRLPICPKSRAALTCRSRWVSWPQAVLCPQRHSLVMNLQVSCPCPANCGRYVVHWRWRKPCTKRARPLPWFCPRAAPKKPPWCLALGFTASSNSKKSCKHWPQPPQRPQRPKHGSLCKCKPICHRKVS